MAVEFGASFFQGELPFYRGAGRIPLGHASGHVGGAFFQGGDALVQALAGDGRSSSSTMLSQEAFLGV